MNGTAARRQSKRVKTPTVLQMEATECGAAALAIVLAYYGRFVPLEKLRIDCGVSRDGSKAANLLKAAQAYGLEAKGYTTEPENLKRLCLPLIVHWNFNHFVVVEGFRKGRVYINDPASGPKVVTAEEFDQAFTGVVLTFEPTDAFQKGGKKPSLLKAVRKRVSGSEIAVVYIVLVGLALVIPGLVIPTFSKVFVDEILVLGMKHWLGPLLLGMGLTAMMRGVLTWLREYHLLRLQTKLALSASSQFFWHVLRLPIGFFTQRYGGEIGARVALNDSVAHLLSGELANTALSVVMVGFYAILMFQYDVLLTLIGIFIAMANIAALRYVSRKRVDKNQRLLAEQGKLTGTSMVGLQMIETLKATGSESSFFERWSGNFAKVINARQELAIYSLALSEVPVLLSSINTLVILAVGGLKVMDGDLSMGGLVAFQTLMASFLTPVANLVNLGSTLQTAEGEFNRLNDVLQHETDARFREAHAIPSDDVQTGTSVILSGALELKSLTFGYNPLEPPLIEDFNLKLAPGSRVALVGATGSGKSTIAKLVSGLYKPWTGEILFDGLPQGRVPRRTLNNGLAMVDQEIVLFEGTIRDNLTMWDSTISEADIVQAAKDARIHGDIVKSPAGYDSRVEENGGNFSGGQRQRLELARALALNPKILVLDEATSALDAVVEAAIHANIKRRGCACLIVAHRLSTIRDCDEIIVLENGAVVERGRHETLCRVDGPYARLIEAD